MTYKVIFSAEIHRQAKESRYLCAAEAENRYVRAVVENRYREATEYHLKIPPPHSRHVDLFRIYILTPELRTV